MNKTREKDIPKLLSLFDGIDDILYVSDPETHELLFVNDEFRRVFGDVSDGDKCYKALQKRDAPCPFCTNGIIFGEKAGQSHVWNFQNAINNRWYRCADKAVRWTDGRMVRFELATDITDHMILESELRLSKEKYQGIFDESITAIYVFDEKKNFIDSNQAGLDLLGYTREELLRMSIPDVDADPVAVLPAHEQLLSGDRIINYEHRLKKKTGEIITVLNNSRPITGKNGDVVGMLSTLIDITERKRLEEEKTALENELLRSQKAQAENALEKSEQFVRSINNNLYNGMIYQVVRMNDGTRKFTYLSDRVKDFYGITPPEGMADANLIYGRAHEDDRVRVFQEEEEANANMTVFQTEVRMLNHRGEIRWSLFISHPRKMEDGSTCWDGIEFDITERKRMEEELKDHRRQLESIVEERTRELTQSENRFKHLADNLPDIIMRWVPNVGLEYTNPAMERILGFKDEQVVRNWGSFMSRVHPEDVRLIGDAFRRIATEKENKQVVEYRVRTESGKTVWLEAIWTPVWEDGKLMMVDAIARDITDRKNMERERETLQGQLIQSQKMEAIGQLAGGIAHDFNNIIATINGTAEMLMKETPPDAPLIGKLERIQRCGARAKDLTMKLLTFARKEKLNVKIINPAEIVADVMDMLRSASSGRIRIFSEFPEEIRRVKVDATQIFQSILNLCLNAVDAMPQGGNLTLRITESVIDDATASAHRVQGGDFVVISVADTGTGIDENNLRNIFDPFFTTKDIGKGSGLGLSISHGILQSHGGFIEVKTNKGAGTTFSVFIPVEDAGESAIEVEKKRVAKTARGNILVIDDDRDFVQMMKDLFELEGFAVSACISGKEARDFYRDNLDKVDMIILDMLLPEMNGSDIFFALRELNPDAKIILCSGYSIEGDATALLKQGALAFLQKPFDVSEAIHIISDILQRN